MLRPGIPFLVACACLALLPACGSEEDTTPAACLNGSGSFLSALQRAPGEVRLVDGVRISECLVEDQPPGELSQVGTAMVGAAERLGAAAREQPQGPAATQLGYLVGAVERGAEETGGVHTELLRRLESVAETGAESPRLEAGYRRGLGAGRESG